MITISGCFHTKNLQSVLISIEERLRNLDSIYKTQYGPTIEGKVEHFGRKLDGLEAKITRLESVVQMEVDKISENMSSRSFKEDLANDHVLRKLDSIYDRINHRLVYMEMKMEMADKKLQVTIQTVHVFF